MLHQHDVWTYPVTVTGRTASRLPPRIIVLQHVQILQYAAMTSYYVQCVVCSYLPNECGFFALHALRLWRRKFPRIHEPHTTRRTVSVPHPLLLSLSSQRATHLLRLVLLNVQIGLRLEISKLTKACRTETKQNIFSFQTSEHLSQKL